MKSGKVSQQRIARDLGVSQALVSLVLNGKRENISEETYQRIWRYAIKIGYEPKGMQFGGRNSVGANVGFILRAGLRLYTQSNFFSHVQHGLHETLHDHGLNSVFLGSEDDLSPTMLRQKLRRSHLFGVIVLGQVTESFARAIHSVQPRIVAVSASYPGLCHSVMPNERQALDQLVQHLIELGHKDFAWLGGNKSLRQSVSRKVAFVEALESRGLKFRSDFAAEADGGDRMDGRYSAEVILSRSTPKKYPTAWIALNGLIARGAINHLMQHGWNVPRQISVTAVDATRVCTEESPEITGANADPEKMGATAAELLLKTMNWDEEALSDVVLPSQLTVRQSSGKPGG